MKAYIKKIYPHDISHEIGISTEVAIDFFGGVHGDEDPIIIEGITHLHRENVRIVRSTDYRFSHEIKNVIADESGERDIRPNDFIVMRKESSVYTLEVVKADNKTQYDLYYTLFSQMGKDRHKLLEFDKDALMKDRFEVYLKEIRKIGKISEQINAIEKWSAKALESGLIERSVFDINDLNEYRDAKEKIFNFDDYIAIKADKKSKNPKSGILNDQALNNYENFLEYLDVLKDRKGRNILLYGVPGSGKSTYVKQNFRADDYHRKRVVFHPEYSFSDFVGQILPQGNKETGIFYDFIPGPFTDILKKAVNAKDKTETFYLIIEEINRGNAPAIFGDLFQLLDRNEDGESEYGIINYDIAREIFKDEDGSANDDEIKNREIKIPTNLWIIATMNTSDQNVFTLDTAFQRRWQMKSIPNDIEEPSYKDKYIDHTEIKWSDFVYVINKTLEEDETISGFGDKRLGAFFAKESELNRELFPEKVLKYLWDDAFKLNRSAVFKDFPSLEKLISKYENAPVRTDALKGVLTDSVYKAMKVGRYNLDTNDLGDDAEIEYESAPLASDNGEDIAASVEDFGNESLSVEEQDNE